MKIFLFLSFLIVCLLIESSFAFFENLFNRPKEDSTVSSTSGIGGASTPRLPVSRVRGVPDSLSGPYENEFFVCDQGKNVFRKHVINDGYCDCEDGSDEPGTSACPTAQFRCVNEGYRMITLPSSRVDDMVCDCCDGSDEVLVSCPNTCHAQAARERAEQEVALRHYQRGSAARQELISAILDRRNTLSEEKQKQAAEVAQLEDHLQRVDRDLTGRISQISSATSNKVSTAQQTLHLVLGIDQADLSALSQLAAGLVEALDWQEEQVADATGLPSQYDSPSTNIEEEFHHEDAFDAYGEEGVPIESQFATCDVVELSNSPALLPFCNVADQDKLVKLREFILSIVKDRKSFSQTMLVLGYAKVLGGWKEAGEAARRFLAENNEDSCPKEFESLSQHCEIKDTLKNAVQDLESAQSEADADSEVQRLRSVQSTLLQQLNTAQTSSSTATHDLQEIEKYKDFAAFLALKDQCFDVVDGKFSYNLCMMQNVKQKEVEGHGQVVLGNFDRFEESNDNGYSVKMHFTNGQYCHAFGARRAEVTAVCGEKNALSSASEPSTCFYTLHFETPAACDPKYATAHHLLL